MAQATFPDGVSSDIPPEVDPVQKAVAEVLDAILKPAYDFMAGMEKINDYAAAGRRLDCEH